jgi:microcystin-dependent protein
MAQPYVGEIRMFAGNFPPNGWMFCEGQLLAIAENDALFALIGTTYGGDGQSTFALPDLRGRIPVHQGPGTPMATQGGDEQVALTLSQVAPHNHALLGTMTKASSTDPQSSVLATSHQGPAAAYGLGNPIAALSSQSVSAAGGGEAHPNLQPYLCINFIISLFGIFPSAA